MLVFLLLPFAAPYIIGIDLGTTFSVVAVYKDGEVQIISDDADRRTTPSVVSCYKGRRVVGDSAIQLRTLSPEETIFAVKWIIGRRYSQPAVQEELHRVPFHTVEREDDLFIKITQDDEDILVSHADVSALALSTLKLQAEK
jgi:molecular chaperone DnaK (HSP70)